MHRVIRFSLDHPFLIIALVVLFTSALGSQLPKITMDPRVEIVLSEDNPAVKLFVENKETFEPYADIIIGMFDTDIFSPSSLEKLQKIVRDLEDVEGVKKVHYILNVKNIQGSESGLDVRPMVRDDTSALTQEEIASLKEKIRSWDVYQDMYVTRDGTGTTLTVVLEDEVESDQIIPIYFTIMDILESHEGPERFYVSGTKVLEALQSHYMIKDLILLPPLVCLVLLTFLFLFFRNIRGMLLPLACVALSATWTVGMMAILGIPLTVVTTALPVALMACGSAYGIHVVENVLADAALGKKGKQGISSAVNRITTPVTMAALTTMAAFMSLCTTTIVPLMHMGLLCAFGLAVAMTLSLTFIPAVMFLLDTHARELVPHHHSKRDIIAPLLRQFSRISLQKSWWVVGVSFVVLIISIVLGSHVKSDLNLIEDFRKGSPIRIADTILNEKFGGTSVFHVVFETAQPDDIKEPSVLMRMDALQQELMALPHVGKAVSIVDFIKRMNQAMHDGDPAYAVIPESKELIAQYLLLFSFSGGEGELDSFVDFHFQKAQIILQKKSLSGYHAQEVVDTVERFRDREVSSQAGTDIITTGLAMMAKEFNHIVVTSQVRSFIISFFLCFIITSFIFRTFKLGFYSMMPLIIPIAFDFAIMGVTGIKLNAATATVASIDIGMGIDYSIHFLNRYRHELRDGHPVEKAIDTALNTAGRGI
ncbi:MAG: MMPL family transporter, partial [Desulfomonilia bacterium]|nr:MMPL family transporter [Desulfomonilia bacterium]